MKNFLSLGNLLENQPCGEIKPLPQEETWATEYVENIDPHLKSDTSLSSNSFDI